MFRRISRSKSGSVLLEFSLASLLYMTVVMTTIEWSLELYVRHASERSLAAALRVYSVTGDEVAAEDAARSATVYILNRCLEPLEFRLYDAILGEDLGDPDGGYVPTGTAADDAAVFARISLRCHWPRFTPAMIATMGKTMSHSVVGVTKMRQ